MEKNIDELLKKGNELVERADSIIENVYNDESIPDDIKNELRGIQNKYENEEMEIQKFLEENKGKEIMYNPTTFKPYIA